MNYKALTIDGPGASGKSTISALIAHKLGLLHLNSGALYRAVGFFSKLREIDLKDEKEVLKVAQKLDFKFKLLEDNTTVLTVDSKDITKTIMTEEVGNLGSKIGVHPKVRELLTDIQRDALNYGSLVLEGRDAGTVVFPKAEFKFYLDADLEERVKRRFLQLKEKAKDKNSVKYENVLKELQERDHRDMTRKASPQKKAEDAIKIDTTKMKIEEVVDFIYQRVKNQLG